MKIAVIYKTVTGHSRKIAKAIAEALGVEAVEIKKGIKFGGGVDLAFIVGGIYSGKSGRGLFAFVKEVDRKVIKRAVLVTSSTSDKRGQNEIREALEANGVVVDKDEYRCKGSFQFILRGHPNFEEIGGAVEFAKAKAGVK